MSYGPWSQSSAILCPPEFVLEVLRDHHRHQEEQVLALEVAVVRLMERQIQPREAAVEVVEERLVHLNQAQVVAALEVEEQNQRPPEPEAHLGPESLVCYPWQTMV